MVLFRTLYKVNLTFLVCGRNPSVTIQMKAIEQYFHVVLWYIFVMLYKVVLTFKPVVETSM